MITLACIYARLTPSAANSRLLRINNRVNTARAGLSRARSAAEPYDTDAEGQPVTSISTLADTLIQKAFLLPSDYYYVEYTLR